MYDLASQLEIFIESTPSYRKMNLNYESPRSNAIIRKKDSINKPIQQRKKVVKSEGSPKVEPLQHHFKIDKGANYHSIRSDNSCLDQHGGSNDMNAQA